VKTAKTEIEESLKSTRIMIEVFLLYSTLERDILNLTKSKYAELALTIKEKE